MGVTQKDIARHLGIDPSAVSYALAGTGTGSEASRQLIVDTARELGYRPNVLARSVRTGKTGTIGLVMGGDFQKISEQLRHIEVAARGQGYHVFVSHGVSQVRSASPEEIVETELSQLERFVEFQVDGLILQTATIYLRGEEQAGYWDRVRALVPVEMPVLIFESPGDHGFAQVFVDRFQWGEQAARQLYALGYRALRFIGNDRTLFSKQMYDGLKRVSEMRCEIFNVSVVDTEAVHEGYRAASIFKQGDAELLVCANARIAYGLLIGLLENGIDVPADVSIVALDQGEILQWPPHSISSIEYRHEELGKQAWQVMSGLLADKKARRSTRLSFHMGEGKTLSKVQ